MRYSSPMKNKFQTEPACGFQVGDQWVTETSLFGRVVRVIDHVSETQIVYTWTNGKSPGDTDRFVRTRPLALKDHWENYETAKCFRAGVQVFPPLENQIVVKVTANGFSKSVAFDPPPPALGVKFYDAAGNAPTACEVRHLKERVRTLDSANLWQSSNLNRLEKEAAVSRQQLAETRDRCNALETRVHDLDSALVHSRSDNETLRTQLAQAKQDAQNSSDSYWALREQLADAKSCRVTFSYHEWARECAEKDCSSIFFDPITGEPNVGFVVGDVWHDDAGYKRTITHVSPSEVHYELSDALPGGFRRPASSERFAKDWSWRIQKLTKFTRAISK